jgi:guanylate kinase
MLLGEFGEEISTTVSHTTRKMREHEVEGVSYYFVSRPEFEEMIAKEAFIEYVECFGNMYGTSKKTVMDSLLKRSSCIMDVEWEGAHTVLHGNFLSKDIRKIGIVILPPSIKAVKERLLNRGSETNESLEIRVTRSFNGIKNIAKYDYIVVNNELNEAYKTIRNIYVEHYRK